MSGVRLAPGGSVEAVVYAVVNSFWAVAAVESSMCSTPVYFPCGNPTIELSGDMSRSPVTVLSPVLVIAWPARIPALQPGAPNAIGDAQAVVAVVNIHTKSCASPLPN
jgi:hypothetical protein